MAIIEPAVEEAEGEVLQEVKVGVEAEVDGFNNGRPLVLQELVTQSTIVSTS